MGLLRSAGVRVDVVGEARCDSSLDDEQATLQECLQANEVCSVPGNPHYQLPHQA